MTGVTEVKGGKNFKQEEVLLGTNGTKGQLGYGHTFKVDSSKQLAIHLLTYYEDSEKNKNSLRCGKPGLKIIPWSESRLPTDEKVMAVEQEVQLANFW